jgi:hypothetical protein
MEESDVLDLSHPLVPAPGPLMPHNALPPAPPLLLGRRGAFTSYVRRRGEPDGRTAVDAGLTHSRASGGRESDAAFTPSPVEPPSMALSLAHQTKIKNLYTPTSSLSTTGENHTKFSTRLDFWLCNLPGISGKRHSIYAVKVSFHEKSDKNSTTMIIVYGCMLHGRLFHGKNLESIGLDLKYMLFL